jgi:hypothetical protein
VAIKAARKPKAEPRTRRRVEADEPSSTTAKKSAQHRQSVGPIKAQAIDLGDGELYISAQLSELVPVAQYSNVTLGPVQLGWKLGGVDMSVLADVDWDDEDTPLTAEQKAVYDKVRGALKSTSMVLEHHLAEDRDTVDRSVRQHNEREASEQSTQKRQRARR